MTAVRAWVAAEAQRMRDGLEAACVAADLGCEVTAHPELAGRVEAWDLCPAGTCSSARRRRYAEQWRPSVAGALLTWLNVLGSQGHP